MYDEEAIATGAIVAESRTEVKIVVIGGSGLIGSKLVSSLRRGVGVLAGAHTVLPAFATNRVNAPTGAELAQMLARARVVVDLANSPAFEDGAGLKFCETAGRDLLAAEAAAGVTHHLTLSSVGVDRHPDAAYFRAKLAQERLVKASGIQYTIVRSTQPFEFTANLIQVSAVGEAVHASPALVQPIAADDAVAIIAETALGSPANDAIEIAGPERIPLDEVVLRYLLARNDRRPVISDVRARCFGLELDDKSLTPSGIARIGPTYLEDWLHGLAP